MTIRFERQGEEYVLTLLRPKSGIGIIGQVLSINDDNHEIAKIALPKGYKHRGKKRFVEEGLQIFYSLD